MDPNQNLAERRFLAESNKEEEVINKVSENQLAHFDESEKVAAVQLPKGVMLRYNLAESLYFYLETLVDGGKIITRVYAANNPYDKDKRVMVTTFARLVRRQAAEFQGRALRTLDCDARRPSAPASRGAYAGND